MTVPEEGPERLAEIFRQIFALSDTNRPNHSKTAASDDSVKSLDTQDASGTSKACAPNGKESKEERVETERQSR